MSKRYEITNEEWERIKEMFPPERTGKKGRLAKNNRSMLNGMLWMARSGAQRRELPERYGPMANSIFNIQKMAGNRHMGKYIPYAFQRCG